MEAITYKVTINSSCSTIFFKFSTSATPCQRGDGIERGSSLNRAYVVEKKHLEKDGGCNL